MAANISLEILPDNPATPLPVVDPGFRLNSGSEWTVTAGNIASAQLSAFAYTVTSPNPNMNSAEMVQDSTFAVGPDCGPDDPLWFLCNPFVGPYPDVAGAFALQYILDSGGNDLVDPPNATLDGGIQTPIGPFPVNQLYDWFAFADQSAIRVITVVGVGASSGGDATLNSLLQRIDPPPPPTTGMPIPGTLFLLGIGLTGMAYRLRSAI